MNYFDLFNLKPTYQLDKDALQSTYLQLQKKYHPDNCDSVEDQLQSVEKVIEINTAYDVLSDNVKLLEYYLKHTGISLSEKEIQSKLSQSDLMFLLDLQESIMKNPCEISLYKQILKEKTSSIMLSLIEAIKQNNKDEIETDLAKLIFFNKSLKHVV
ncbi:MAG TPA: Fe-S protein assembly co-chaperone HscB [Alphaproteobacteria bacterium]|nr:Fe-S protein assembly co-chaperone HscB [Alphaproteobacteria bacterium]